MNIQLIINPLHFNLLINNENIRFNLEEIECMEIKHIINYTSLISCFISLTLFTLLSILFFKITYFILIILNLILFLVYTDFVYKKVFQINLRLHGKDYNLILNDEYAFFEFKFLYKMYNKQID
jgi:hypothetical protein